MVEGHQPCYCRASKCLKLYCACFAAGKPCDGCNCQGCLNVDGGAQREAAVKATLARDPDAFASPKPIFSVSRRVSARPRSKASKCFFVPSLADDPPARGACLRYVCYGSHRRDGSVLRDPGGLARPPLAQQNPSLRLAKWSTFVVPLVPHK